VVCIVVYVIIVDWSRHLRGFQRRQCFLWTWYCIWNWTL